MINKVLSNYKTVYVDIDDTLAMGDLSAYPNGSVEKIAYTNGDVRVVKNVKNINLMIYFYKLGYSVIVWSKTGSDWAEAVCKHFNVDEYVSLYLTKPMFYIDDADVTSWIGPRRWRDCK